MNYGLRINGKFEFFLEYNHTSFNRWRQTKSPWDEPSKFCEQTSNSVSACPVDGFECIDCRLNYSWWGGLGRSDKSTSSVYSFIDGSIGSSAWHFAIGSTKSWTDKLHIPGAKYDVMNVTLWMRFKSQNTCKINKSYHLNMSFVLLFMLTY